MRISSIVYVVRYFLRNTLLHAYNRFEAFHSLGVSCSRDDLSFRISYTFYIISCNNHVSCVITEYRSLNSFFFVHTQSFSSTCLSCVCLSTSDFEIFGYMKHMGFEHRRMCMAGLTCNRNMSQMSQIASTSFSATFTHLSLRHGACQIGDLVIMTRRLVLQQVDSLFRFVLTI